MPLLERDVLQWPNSLSGLSHLSGSQPWHSAASATGYMLLPTCSKPRILMTLGLRIVIQ